MRVQCRTCGRDKPSTEFYTEWTAHDTTRIRPRCKACIKRSRQMKASREKTKEPIIITDISAIWLTKSF